MGNGRNGYQGFGTKTRSYDDSMITSPQHLAVHARSCGPRPLSAHSVKMSFMDLGNQKLCRPRKRSKALQVLGISNRNKMKSNTTIASALSLRPKSARFAMSKKRP